MDTQPTYTEGDRVRLVCDCPGARAGDEGTVVAVKHSESTSAEALTVLINHDPATAHGVTVYEHEVEPVTPETRP